MDGWHSSSANAPPVPLRQIPTEPNQLSRRPDWALGVSVPGYPLLQAAAGKTPEISGNIIQPVGHFNNGPTEQYGAILRNFDRHRAPEKLNRPFQMSSQMGDSQINRTLELLEAVLHSFEYLRDPCTDPLQIAQHFMISCD